MVRDPASGKYRRTRLFVLTLGYSRKSVRLLVRRSSAQLWAELHERAFRRLGGTVRVVVLDNLKEGVLTPDIYDPTLNPLYRDVLAHYGVVALPCRVRDPDRKGKVEAAVGHAQKTPLRGLRFEHLDDAQGYLDRWERRWADTRIHGTIKRQVAALFAEERPALGPLPLEPFRSYQYGHRIVHLDGCVEVASAYSSAPPGWVGRRCLTCPAVPGAIGHRCPATTVARLCRRVSCQRVPGLDSRTVLRDGSARRVDDVCGPRLVRGVGTRRVRAGDRGAHGVQALARPSTECVCRFEIAVGHGCAPGSFIPRRRPSAASWRTRDGGGSR